MSTLILSNTVLEILVTQSDQKKIQSIRLERKKKNISYVNHFIQKNQQNLLKSH